MSTARGPGPADHERAVGSPADMSPLARMVVSRTILLSEIPAPPLGEQQRAQVVRDWWVADGLPGVGVDAAGNVRARLRAGDRARPAVLLCAHLDTVFGPDVRHGLTRQGQRLTGPGAGDNTVAVCSLSALDALLPGRLRHPVWIAATVGEEGLGNLAGIRALLDDPPGPVRAVIALEGNYLGRVNVTGVGSARWQVTVTGPGGHAWEEAGQPSAVHEAARLITELAALARIPPRPAARQPLPPSAHPPEPTGHPPEPTDHPPKPTGQPPEPTGHPPEPTGQPLEPTGHPPKTSVNIGRIEGGESVNSRAQRAEFLLDLRSGDAAALKELQEAAGAIMAGVAAPAEVSVRVIGERPAGRLDPGHPLATLAADVLREAGIAPQLTAASTDANAAYPLAIPALTLGITTGDGTHTEHEWIDTGPIATGLAALAATVARLDEQEW